MLVVIKLAEDLAPDAIQNAVRFATGSGLRPMSMIGSLQNFFWVDVPDIEAAGRLAEQLRELPGVEAAYVKPPDESP